MIHRLDSNPSVPIKSVVIWFVATCIVFAILRLPMVFLSAGQNDEEYFATAGLMVWRTGIPSFPLCRTFDGDVVIESANPTIRGMSNCLFLIPPGLQYLQAPFFAVFPASYVTARLPVVLAGFASFYLLFLLVRGLIATPWMIGLSMLAFAVSRPLMFSATIARPDLVCAVIGWCAILSMQRWQVDSQMRWLVIAGICCGLGLLNHPFALVFCLQIGVWALSRTGTIRERLGRATVVTGCCLVVFSSWLLLVAAFPNDCVSQFSHNVLNNTGPGLGARIVWPWQSLYNHWDIQLEYNGPFQMGWLVGGILLGTICWLRMSNAPDHRRYLLLFYSACYLTAVLAGMHRTKGYWLYAIGLAYPLAVEGWAGFVDSIRQRFLSPSRGTFLTPVILTLGTIVLMLPGAGLRTVSDDLLHWNDERFNAPKLVERVLRDLPADGLFMADQAHVLDLYLSGRRTVFLGPRQSAYWGGKIPAVDYLVITRLAKDTDWASVYDVTLLRREGSSNDSENYIEIYRVNGLKK